MPATSQIRYRYSIINGYAIVVPDEFMSALSENPNIRSVDLTKQGWGDCPQLNCYHTLSQSTVHLMPELSKSRTHHEKIF